MIEKLQSKLKVEIKNKDKATVMTLRNLIGKLKMEQINKGNKLNNQECIKVLQKIAKQHKDSIKQYSIGLRDDLVKKEKFELSVVKEFLPSPISSDELELKINEIIGITGATSLKDMGSIMKLIMKDFSGIVDGNDVKKILIKKFN
tara:strand:+ start:87 stop:524 length:438 start_codon:yes stop_codon:yes gene_type:complete